MKVFRCQLSIKPWNPEGGSTLSYSSLSAFQNDAANDKLRVTDRRIYSKRVGAISNINRLVSLLFQILNFGHQKSIKC